MSSTKFPAAVLWDLDGTLVDSENYWLSSEKQLAAEHGYDWTEQDGLDLVGFSLFESGEIIRVKIGSQLTVLEIIERLTMDVVEQLKTSIAWRPGAQELLSELRAAGVKTALVTMSFRNMAELVVNSIGFEAFDVIVAGDEVEFGKPHPEAYLKAAELLGVEPGQCVALEDSLTGLTSAERAGTVAIGIPNVSHIPEAENRVLWKTLAGVTLSDLQALF
jgi:hypothetical protein